MLSAAVQEQGTEMEDRFMFHKNMDMRWLVSKLKFIIYFPWNVKTVRCWFYMFGFHQVIVTSFFKYTAAMISV